MTEENLLYGKVVTQEAFSARVHTLIDEGDSIIDAITAATEEFGLDEEAVPPLITQKLLAELTHEAKSLRILRSEFRTPELPDF